MKKPNFKKVTGKAVVSDVAVPIGCAVLGAVAGAAGGRTVNYAVAAALGIASLAMSEPNLMFAAAGAAVVNPPAATTVKGLDGLDGITDVLMGAKNRAFGQVKATLTNAHLNVLADKIPVSGLNGLGDLDAYNMGMEQGYIQGVDDTVEEFGGGEVSGFLTPGSQNLALPGGPAGERMSPESQELRKLIGM